MKKDTKITVAGIGGVGGYLGAMLARRYDHVTMVARGERKKRWKHRGFICIVNITEKSLCIHGMWWRLERRYRKNRILFSFV